MSQPSPERKGRTPSRTKGTANASLDRSELMKKLEANRLYIARLEATLAAGGLSEKCAKLEGKVERLQKRLQAQGLRLQEQLHQCEDQDVELVALRTALHHKAEEWGLGPNGDGGAMATLVANLAKAKEEANRKQQQLVDQAAAMEKMAHDMAELTFANKTLQTSLDQATAEGRQQQEHISWLTSEIQAMEETKQQMLEHLEQALEENASLRQKLEQEGEARKELESRAQSDAEQMSRVLTETQTEVEDLNSKHRQLLMLRALQTQKLSAETDRADQAEQTIRDLQERIAQLNEIHTDDERRLAVLQQSLSDALQDRDIMAQQSTDHQKKAEMMTAQCKDLMARLQAWERSEGQVENMRTEIQRLSNNLGRIGEYCRQYLIASHGEQLVEAEPYQLVTHVVSHAAKLQATHEGMKNELRGRITDLEATLGALQMEHHAIQQQLQAKSQEVQRLQLLNEASRRRFLLNVREHAGSLAENWKDGSTEERAPLSLSGQSHARSTPSTTPQPYSSSRDAISGSGRLLSLTELAQEDSDALGVSP